MADDRSRPKPKPGRKTLGARLSSAREAHGLSAAQLARRLGVKSETIRSWETDRSEPRANRITILAGLLGVSASWLLMGKGKSPPPPRHELEAVRGEILQLGTELTDMQARLVALADRLEAHQIDEAD